MQITTVKINNDFRKTNSYDLKYYFNKSRSIKEIINFIERELNNK